MSNLYDLLALLLLGAGVGAWMKLSAAREHAVRAARRLCEQHDLQLLDETVGLRSMRLRRVDGRLCTVRCYDFEVSLDGHDRQPGRLWMVEAAVIDASLPAREVLPADQPTVPPRDTGNVVSLASRRRRSPSDWLH